MQQGKSIEVQKTVTEPSNLLVMLVSAGALRSGQLVGKWSLSSASRSSTELLAVVVLFVVRRRPQIVTRHLTYVVKGY